MLSGNTGDFSALSQKTVPYGRPAGNGNLTVYDKKLLRETSPVAAIISYAKDNDYGYPHREVVKALRDLRIMRFDTADGTLKFSTDGKRLTYDKNREVNGFGR